MVKHQRQNHHQHQWRKREEGLVDEEVQHPFGLLCENYSNYHHHTKTRPKLLFSMFVCVVSCCCFIFALQLLTSSSISPLLYSFGSEDAGSEIDGIASICSSVTFGTICCDRSSIRSDICIMKGDVRTESASSSVFLYRNGFRDRIPDVSESDGEEEVQHEKIRPYTRKWETSVMNTIDELNLVVTKENVSNHRKCDVQHDVPAVFFSTGGYTGNLYHEFNDGIIPLYITSQKYNKKVVFVILEYHNWWITKYGDILSHLTDYPAIDFSKDKRIHCFPEAIVGLKIHDELAIDPSLMEGNKTIGDFRSILDRAYWPRIRDLIQDEEREAESKTNNISSSSLSLTSPMKKMNEKEDLNKPKLAILSRNDSRAIVNEDSLARIAEEIGFRVEFIRPDKTTELAKIYRVLNSSDAMIGVHGAAMTHFLFMQPGSVFIQVIPLGTDWAADTYYGQPAIKLGLRYIGYKILPRESSLSEEYDKNDPVLIDPSSVTNRGWEFTKRVYLDSQNVKLDIGRFRKHLLGAYHYTISRKGMHTGIHD